MLNPMTDLHQQTTGDSVPAHPAATVILLRPAHNGFEVLLLLRNQAVKFAGNNWVFPGGRIDQQDYRGDPDDEKTAARVAAARESKEEASLDLSPEEFHFFSHWTTPVVEKKRFATWFLLGAVHGQQDITVDACEIVDHLWLHPCEALQRHRAGELPMFPPTFLSLLELSKINRIVEVIKAIESREPPSFFPKLVLDGKAPVAILEGDTAYASGDLKLPGTRHRMVYSSNGWEYIKI